MTLSCIRRSNLRWGVMAALVVVGFTWASTTLAESRFEFDLRLLDGAVGVGPKRTDGSITGGIRLGDSTWFGKDSSVGMVILAGAEGGALFSKKIDGNLIVGGELGAQFWGSRGHKSGSGLAVSWAPKMFVNLAGGGEVASPLGAEVAFNLGVVKFPLWFLHTLDNATFFGGAIAFVF